MTLLFLFSLFLQLQSDSIYKSRNIEKEKKLQIEVNLSNYLIEIKKCKKLFDVKLKFTEKDTPKVEYEKEKLLIKHSRRISFLPTIIGYKNKCELLITEKLPIVLNIIASMCKTEIDLSGIKIKELYINTSGKTRIVVNTPNSIKCEKIYINAGTGKFESKGLVNTNFTILYFNGTVGSYILDLTGEFCGEKRVEISIGIGSINLIIPKETGVKIHTAGTRILSNSEIIKLEDNWYETKNWNKAKKNFIIHARTSIGSINIDFI